MRVYWLNGGLHLEPESNEEGDALNLLVSNLRLSQPAEVGQFVGPGSCAAGDDLIDRISSTSTPKRGLSVVGRTTADV